ncbi:G protein-coupled glucose receptor regulating Gpa2-domain-containing protein [Desarmillaria tabescens]|uniref:G protein-coupled glucose receptor regulating Gpa2-domain-containing protein n=1 Tax=Armillaria tabescens TaxID=1929756 RepID=A0AA39JDK2_ARMTA|nr:G protein-coupled glucose receptor regulating Gpa2-domain-containing protein [Desarmillaria tabescens]KAK0439980.1 G protein-coupled glucose receptor regulating Gpa2-domain-containing protein [Desarmillaria tabescens]
MTLDKFELVLALTNFVGSVLSAIGSGFIILCYAFLPVKRHYRHLLILNLAIADFINGMNNGISGAVILATGPLTRSRACIANGFIGRLSVQATDTSIWAIAIVTVVIVTASYESWLGDSKKDIKWFVAIVCACAWVMPLITSFVALGKGYYTNVSGNWCWLTSEPTYLRYVLTHAWRFLFTFIEIGLYAYLYIHLRRRITSMTVTSPRTALLPQTNLSQDARTAPLSIDAVRMQAHMIRTQHHECRNSIVDISVQLPIPSAATTTISRPSTLITSPPEDRYKHISKILLLNAYPIAYVVLWIPGLCNRLVEASGHSSRVLQITQASTQFIGFANALTYGWNENVARSMREMLKRKSVPS